MEDTIPNALRRLTARLTATPANIGKVTDAAVPDRPSRSSFQTTRASPGRSLPGPLVEGAGRSAASGAGGLGERPSPHASSSAETTPQRKLDASVGGSK